MTNIIAQPTGGHHARRGGSCPTPSGGIAKPNNKPPVPRGHRGFVRNSDDWAIRDRPLASSLALTLAAGASWLAGWATAAPAVGFIVASILAIVAWRTKNVLLTIVVGMVGLWLLQVFVK